MNDLLKVVYSKIIYQKSSIKSCYGYYDHFDYQTQGKFQSHLLKIIYQKSFIEIHVLRIVITIIVIIFMFPIIFIIYLLILHCF